jgi:hypothetical protein
MAQFLDFKDEKEWKAFRLGLVEGYFKWLDLINDKLPKASRQSSFQVTAKANAEADKKIAEMKASIEEGMKVALQG